MGRWVPARERPSRRSDFSFGKPEGGGSMSTQALPACHGQPPASRASRTAQARFRESWESYYPWGGVTHAIICPVVCLVRSAFDSQDKERPRHTDETVWRRLAISTDGQRNARLSELHHSANLEHFAFATAYSRISRKSNVHCSPIGAKPG